ncbi:endonuclease Q family protein [Metabacillus sediminilitoris]|uniref:TIGR00375 family protein n=1 Tax=Metabacillus sediminilitoris TaxID=2567941 RepID=A0A4S4BYU8_9BACI|nr:endonuclease Q family protein [Metabacillus sediminilitoris]QGQ47104.1 TIGR00375 family protein [Metabacillus sediminilitoris]THF80448.1 TIGR00375 family protein [Metabacillus sediminilitoris]
MNRYFADLHIHIGQTTSGRPVKITASKSLTLENILVEASEHKGMDMIGIIDCHVPEILLTLKKLIENGVCMELSDGGIRFYNTTLILGSELEIYDDACKGPIHVLAFLPTLEKMQMFSNWLSSRLTNLTLSSQRIYENGKTLQKKVKELGGLFIPAHIFTPHKSLYGSGVIYSLEEVFDGNLIDAVELGLSSDTKMADQIAELHRYTFLTNSDAHSLPKIGREYQRIILQEPTFLELKMALAREDGRRIEANYGLNPYLGKYYETTCEKCGVKPLLDEKKCKNCGSTRFTKGVSNRLKELAGGIENSHERPPYIHQVPLQFIPGLGPKTLEKLKNMFGTEMNILHEVPREALGKVVKEKIVDYIVAAREGSLKVKTGGGGIYGKITGV